MKLFSKKTEQKKQGVTELEVIEIDDNIIEDYNNYYFAKTLKDYLSNKYTIGIHKEMINSYSDDQLLFISHVLLNDVFGYTNYVATDIKNRDLNSEIKKFKTL